MTKKSNGIVNQLIQNALSNKVSVINLLHYCFYIANQLNLLKQSFWIVNELEGYDKEDIPNYRKVPCQIKSLRRIAEKYEYCKIENLINIIEGSNNPEWKTLYPNYFVSYPLSQVENISAENIQKDPIFRLSENLYNYVVKESNKNFVTYPKSIDIIVDRFKFNNITHSVKTKILEWAIELKNLGIDSEGIDFTQEDKIIAEKNFAGMLSHNQNCQIVYAVNSSNSSQNTTDYIQSQNFEENDIEKILQSIQKSKILESCSPVERNKIEKELYSLQKEKEPSKVRAILSNLHKDFLAINESGALTEIIKVIGMCMAGH